MPAGADGSARTAALNPRVEQIATMLERARQRGEIVPTVAEVLDHLLAPIYTRKLFGAPADETMAEQLTDRLIA
jgi:hypothetical protein